MPVTLGITSYRLPSVTPQEFKTHYETEFAPMLKNIFTGDAAPLSYRRHYLNRTSDGKPVLIHGDVDRVDWDLTIEVTFRDEEHLRRYVAVHEVHKAAILEREATFVDRTKVLVTFCETEGS